MSYGKYTHGYAIIHDGCGKKLAGVVFDKEDVKEQARSLEWIGEDKNPKIVTVEELNALGWCECPK
jgi:hypothetical protein